MAILFQSHGGKPQEKPVRAPESLAVAQAAAPAGGDIAVDEQADFGYLFPPSGNPDDYLPETAETVGHLDELGDLMVDAANAGDPPAADSKLAPVLTYWGQFLDHELTARTDRESGFTSIVDAHPPKAAAEVEETLRNARSPRFDLDSVYGGAPVGAGVTADVVKVIMGMRHPKFTSKMRVGSADTNTELPDGLDRHRDLPRYGQVQASVRNAALDVARATMATADFDKFEASLATRALIGDQRNDENLIVAQFHVSFLRFHNKAVDFLAGRDTGWLADFHSAQTLTRLHYQWLVVEGYLKGVCQPAVVERVLQDRAKHFFQFRAEYDARRPGPRLGNALPLEFSVAGYRFGHSMVRAAYDHNKIFGRPNGQADFFLLFLFTGGGGLGGDATLPQNWIIDWSRFVKANPPTIGDGQPERVARRIDTELAPPLGVMDNEGNDENDPEQVRNLFKHLAKRNLRRGYNLSLPTGQALHRHLNASGAVTSAPIADVSTIFAEKPDLKGFLETVSSGFATRTPLWFYILAEAEKGGGETLGELGSWIVASTFVGVLLSDPDSALSRRFEPKDSPLKMKDGSAIDTIENGMKFALVLE